MPGRHFLHIPGPTNVPDRVLNAMHVPMQDHRSPVFPQLLLPLLDSLKRVFKSEAGQAFIFASTGTGAWETVLTNTLCEGDKVLAPRFGQFSHLWIDAARRLGLEVQVQEEPWGSGASPERIYAALEQDRGHEIRAVLIVHNETATGVTSDLPAIRRAIDAAKHPALLFVDGVSSIACIDFRMDEWGVDAAVAGSQKGLMMPAGLGLSCFSQKALEAGRSARKNNALRRSYFDIETMAASNKTGYFPYTPSLPLLYALREALRMLEEEGLDNVFARHARLAGGVRAAISEGWGLQLCAAGPQWHSNTVSAVVVPDGADAVAVIERAFRRYELSLGSGLAQLNGKVFRIGHLGDLNELMCLAAIAGAEMAMQDCGIAVEPGSGAAAAQRFYRAAG